MSRRRAVTSFIALAATTSLAVPTAAFAANPAAYDAIEQCATWSGTIQYFPALTKSQQQVTAVMSLTLGDCSIDGTLATGTGSVFATFAGIATSHRATLTTGHLAVTWPQDQDLDPSVASTEVASRPGAYTIEGTVTNGAFSSDLIGGTYAVTAHAKIPGGTAQDITGTQPFYTAPIDSSPR